MNNGSAETTTRGRATRRGLAVGALVLAMGAAFSGVASAAELEGTYLSRESCEAAATARHHSGSPFDLGKSFWCVSNGNPVSSSNSTYSLYSG